MELAELLRDVPMTKAMLTTDTVSGITSDSRRVRGGELLICIRGLHRDGHDHVAEGIERGAAVVLAESKEAIPPGISYILTPDTRLAEALVWNNRYGRPADGMTKIGITGTSGKTTTAHLLRDLLQAGGHRVGAITTAGGFVAGERIPFPDGGTSVTDAAAAMTTPDPEYFYGMTAAMAKAGCDTLVYEASSQGLALHKTDAITPDYALFTNLSPEHMDFHGTMETYLAAKARLFTKAKTGILLVDDPWAEKLMALAPACTWLTCTTDPAKATDCDSAALRIRSHGAEGMSFLYCGREAIFRIRTPLTGICAVYDLLLCVTCALQMGVDPLTIQDALTRVQFPAGRMQKLELPAHSFTVYIDYAHTPAALEMTLQAAKAMHPTRLTVLFGCGGDRDPTKRPVMGHIAETYADRVVVTDDNPRTEDPAKIRQAIVDGMEKAPYAVIPDRKEAIVRSIREAVAGEMILLCGKGHESWQIIGKEKLPFDEEAIVRAALQNRETDI